MSPVELPRALEDYFAHAETAPTRDGRRFTITLPYLDGARLDRLQWWWSLGTVQEKILGEESLVAARQHAIERFRRHIERWLTNNDKRFFGDGPIPQLGIVTMPAVSPEPTALADATSSAASWRQEKVANG